MYIYALLCIYIYVYTCMYMYIYIFIHVYICIFMYIYISCMYTYRVYENAQSLTIVSIKGQVSL